MLSGEKRSKGLVCKGVCTRCACLRTAQLGSLSPTQVSQPWIHPTGSSLLLLPCIFSLDSCLHRNMSRKPRKACWAGGALPPSAPKLGTWGGPVSRSCQECLSPCVRASRESRAVTHLPARKDVLVANRTLHRQRLTEKAFTARHKLRVSNPEAPKWCHFLPSSGEGFCKGHGKQQAVLAVIPQPRAPKASALPEDTGKDSPQ